MNQSTAITTTGSEAESQQLASIRMQIAELEQQLLANDPALPMYLKRIHANLLQYPELVHIIQPEERATIIAGLSRLTGSVLIAAEKKTTAKKLSSHTVDDI